MKKILTVFAFIFTCLIVEAQNSDVTTYYFIRHAEKVRTDTSNKDPNLNAKGLQRAKKWKEVFIHVKFDAIYTTDYHRTKQTAKPTADSKNLPVFIYNPGEIYNDAFKSETKGKTVLVVGHSNTTPFFVNKVIGKNKYLQIDDQNNSNLYIVTITKGKTTDILLKIDMK